MTFQSAETELGSVFRGHQVPVGLTTFHMKNWLFGWYYVQFSDINNIHSSWLILCDSIYIYVYIYIHIYILYIYIIIPWKTITISFLPPFCLWHPHAHHGWFPWSCCGIWGAVAASVAQTLKGQGLAIFFWGENPWPMPIYPMVRERWSYRYWFFAIKWAFRSYQEFPNHILAIHSCFSCFDVH